MTKQEEQYFAALSKDRAENADSLEKPSMKGIKNSVVEKYSDQAHFIYELLQNADDAQATKARFVLEPTRLIFAHNGTRQFSVSDMSPVRRKIVQKENWATSMQLHPLGTQIKRRHPSASLASDSKPFSNIQRHLTYMGPISALKSSGSLFHAY